MDYYHSLTLLSRKFLCKYIRNNKLKLGNKCAYSKNFFLVEKHLIKLKIFKLAFFAVLSFSPNKYHHLQLLYTKDFLKNKKALLASFF